MRVVFIGRDRSVWKRLVLYVVTLGITRRIWLYRLNKEMDGHLALGLDHRVNAGLLVLPVLGPTIVTAQTSGRVRRMLGGTFAYGPAWAVYLATWVPILGNLFFIGWTQDRVNRYWRESRRHPEQGIDIDVGLEDDPEFLVEMGQALKESYEAGSRFDRKKQRRRERWRHRKEHWRAIQDERARVRAAGGSTPMLPWLRPRREPRRVMHITCGRCAHRFDLERDPYAETPVVCPECGLSDVLPSLRSDPLAGTQRGGIVKVEVDCPDCGHHFHARRDSTGKTRIACPQCGKADTLPPVAAGS